MGGDDSGLGSQLNATCRLGGSLRCESPERIQGLSSVWPIKFDLEGLAEMAEFGVSKNDNTSC
jgi:hypothetical protein